MLHLTIGNTYTFFHQIELHSSTQFVRKNKQQARFYYSLKLALETKTDDKVDPWEISDFCQPVSSEYLLDWLINHLSFNTFVLSDKFSEPSSEEKADSTCSKKHEPTTNSDEDKTQQFKL